jgi:hypothetical protein
MTDTHAPTDGDLRTLHAKLEAELILTVLDVLKRREDILHAPWFVGLALIGGATGFTAAGARVLANPLKCVQH